MLKDGNDDRGIDVGIMTRNTFDILSIVSHVNDIDEKGRIFSRDCTEYQIRTPSAETLLVLVNHLRVWDMVHRRIMRAKCKRQAKRVREIYEERVNQGLEFIAIAGDLNDIPDRDPLQPLLGNGSNLIEVMQHSKFRGDGRPGTHGHGNKGDKLDYILMSPPLANRIQFSHIFQKLSKQKMPHQIMQGCG